MNSSLWRRKRFLLALLPLPVVLTALLFPFPLHGRIWNEVFNLAHAPAFFSLVLAIAGILHPAAIGLPQRFGCIVTMTGFRIACVAGVSLGLGLAGEWLQAFVNRSPSWQDAAANAAGVAAATLWITGCLRGKRFQAAGGLLAAVILLAVSANPLLEIHDSVLQKSEFPLIASFERNRELNTWHTRHSHISADTSWSTDGQRSLKVSLHRAAYPGIRLKWPPEDWSPYRTLQIDVRNPGTEPIDLLVKVADRLHTQTGFQDDDRFEWPVVLNPSETTTVRIDLLQVKAAAASRTMQMDQIALFEIFALRSSGSNEFQVDNIRLE
jgi:VanZ family protein